MVVVVRNADTRKNYEFDASDMPSLQRAVEDSRHFGRGSLETPSGQIMTTTGAFIRPRPPGSDFDFKWYPAPGSGGGGEGGGGSSGLYGTALLVSFKALLNQGGKQRPKPEVLNKIQRYYPTSLSACGDPAVAVELYDRADRVPETITRQDIAASLDILVDGVFSPPNQASSTLLYAYHQGKIMLLKIPPDVASARRELSMWNELITDGGLNDALHHNLAGPLVEVPITSHPNNEQTSQQLIGILMPLYPATLDQAAFPMPAGDVLRVGKEILTALAFMHKKGYGHNDVKPSNVLLSTEGRCRLCDFGSAAAIGTPVSSSTPVFRASDAGSVTAAQFDCKMLAATLLYKLGLHAAETAPNVPQMSSLALQVVHDDLKAFLLTLLA